MSRTLRPSPSKQSESLCFHLEYQREYVFIEMPADGQEALTADGARTIAYGFRCGGCGNFFD
jgi:hypothetical protein